MFYTKEKILFCFINNHIKNKNINDDISTISFLTLYMYNL